MVIVKGKLTDNFRKYKENLDIVRQKWYTSPIFGGVYDEQCTIT